MRFLDKTRFGVELEDPSKRTPILKISTNTRSVRRKPQHQFCRSPLSLIGPVACLWIRIHTGTRKMSSLFDDGCHCTTVFLSAHFKSSFVKHILRHSKATRPKRDSRCSRCSIRPEYAEIWTRIYLYFHRQLCLDSAGAINHAPVVHETHARCQRAYSAAGCLMHATFLMSKMTALPLSTRTQWSSSSILSMQRSWRNSKHTWEKSAGLW